MRNTPENNRSVDLLRVVVLVVGPALVADADIKKPIRPKQQTPAVVPLLQDRTAKSKSARNPDPPPSARRAQVNRDTRQYPEIPVISTRRVLVSHINVSPVRRSRLAELRVKRKIRHAAVAVAVNAAANVQKHLGRARRLVVLELSKSARPSRRSAACSSPGRPRKTSANSPRCSDTPAAPPSPPTHPAPEAETSRPDVPNSFRSIEPVIRRGRGNRAKLRYGGNTKLPPKQSTENAPMEGFIVCPGKG